VLSPNNNGILPIQSVPTGFPYVELIPEEESIILSSYGNCSTYKWIECIGRWQNITALLANYGKQPAQDGFWEAVERLQLVDFQPLDVVTDDNYSISLEKANNVLFLHSDIWVWNREVKKHFFQSVNQLQKDVFVDSYIYSLKPNEEYVKSGDTTLKFAEMIGYKFFERVVLNDGFEHDVYKRNRNLIL
jgi:hypothetical protein